MLQALTGLDRQAHASGRIRIATLRPRLLTVPGRLSRHARDLTLRLPPDQQNLQAALTRLRALPTDLNRQSRPDDQDLGDTARRVGHFRTTTLADADP